MLPQASSKVPVGWEMGKTGQSSWPTLLNMVDETQFSWASAQYFVLIKNVLVLLFF